MNEVYLYRGSLEYARRNNEVSLWRASHRANIACKKAIEESIRQGFDGMHLQEGCIQGVLEEYGFKRVNWVLANTVREKLWDWPTVSEHWNWCAAYRCFPPTGKGKAFSHLIRGNTHFGPNGQKRSWRWRHVSGC